MRLVSANFTPLLDRFPPLACYGVARLGKPRDQAAKLYIQAARKGASEWDPQPFGFKFSMEQIEMRSLEIEPNLWGMASALQPGFRPAHDA